MTMSKVCVFAALADTVDYSGCPNLHTCQQYVRVLNDPHPFKYFEQSVFFILVNLGCVQVISDCNLNNLSYG